MSKKDSIVLRLRKRGYSGGKIKWVPNNIHGKSPTLRGWLFKLEENSEWQVLGTNYEDAIKKIDSLQIKQNI